MVSCSFHSPCAQRQRCAPALKHIALYLCTYCIGILVGFFACTSQPSFISIFPPVCRNIAKQTFLETLQDNLIEMDILASAHRDAAYSDGYVACLLSDSYICQNLLCYENKCARAVNSTEHSSVPKCCRSPVYVSCSGRVFAALVPSLFNATKKMCIESNCWVLLLLINVKHDRFMNHCCPRYRSLLEKDLSVD